MRKLILLMHSSLDGFVATESGGLEWIKIDDELFGDVGNLTKEADAALYGRVTYEMMENYWPNAGTQPNASRHDIEHSDWYNSVTKYVLSHGQPPTGSKAEIIGKDLAGDVQKIKSLPGKNILMIGSPGAAHSLMQKDLIDEFWLCIYPVLLGGGIPLFPSLKDKVELTLDSSKNYKTGPMRLIYSLSR
jgi:dihydrofolate reductase